VSARAEGAPGAIETAQDQVVVRNFSRRDFVKGSLAVAGSGMILGVFVGCSEDMVDQAVADMISGAVGGTRSPGDGGFEPNVFVRLLTSGDVEITVSRTEMGQGSRTAMAQLVADELEADWARVRVVQAQGDAKYGDQNTDGSRSVRNLYEPLRQAGATARRMLEQAAADQWGVPVEECSAVSHTVTHSATGQSAPYGELVEAAMDVAVPEGVPLKDPADFRYIGKDVAMLDGLDIAMGRGLFGADVSLPGMLYACMERSPVVGGSVRSFNADDARAVPGVVDVVTIPAPSFPVVFQPLGGVAVIAENTWAAMEGRRRLGIEWNPGPNASHESGAYRAQLEASVNAPGRVARDEGDVDAALASADRTMDASYYVPYLAHAPMEPMACLANLAGARTHGAHGVPGPCGRRPL